MQLSQDWAPVWSFETEIYPDQHLAFVLVSLLRGGDAVSSVQGHRDIGRIPPTQGNTMRLGKGMLCPHTVKPLHLTSEHYPVLLILILKKKPWGRSFIVYQKVSWDAINREHTFLL